MRSEDGAATGPGATRSRPTDRKACQRCRYYQVTWDPRLPYGCAAHGFKTRRNPAHVVYESSGIDCLLFDPKG
jgi:hypothetical protein